VRRIKMNKAIITVVGKDRVGIIAGVCTYLAENQINILDITQTIVKGFFNMMMVVDVENITMSFGEVARELEQVGEEIGVSVKIQREEIFLKMHRI
jgi:ACT domain-containing protein